MTIENLFRYLEKNNIAFNKVAYKWDYFESAPVFSYVGCNIDLVYKDVKDLNDARMIIEKYCNRYDFDIFHVGRLSCDVYGNYHYFMAIRTAADAAGAKLYAKYSDACMNDFESLHHNFIIRGLSKSHFTLFKHIARNLIESYSNQYIEALKAV